jgi:hypothetical protein
VLTYGEKVVILGIVLGAALLICKNRQCPTIFTPNVKPIVSTGGIQVGQGKKMPVLSSVEMQVGQIVNISRGQQRDNLSAAELGEAYFAEENVGAGAGMRQSMAS